jgi:glycosyltransferase involved in cell wall biosynthesis
MKILYHHRTLSRDGQEVHIQEMIAALARRGHEVILVAPAPPRARGSDAPDTSRLRQWLPRPIAELLELAYSVPAYLRLRRAWRRHRPDILYERYNLLLLSGVWLRAHSKIPMLLEVNAPICDERKLHGGLSWPGLARWVERHVWQRSDMLLPVTAVLADSLTAADVPWRRIQVIANGVDRRRFQVSPAADHLRSDLGLAGKLVLGFTGFIRPWHGLPRVVEAVAALADRPDLHLLVVGDGPGRGDVEERARQLRVADQVTITGVVARDRVSDHISLFDIALQPHVVAYASPLKLFEYMALGCAIIAPDQPNIREVLRHERDALLFSPLATHGMMAVIKRLCDDPGLRRQLGAGALRTLESGGFSWDHNAAKIETIAHKLLAQRGKAGGSPQFEQ